MSFLTATQPELIFKGFTAGSALSNTTTATCISPRGNTVPLPYLPPGFFSAAYGANRGLRIVARGVVSTAGSSPGTMTIGAYLASTDTATLGTPSFLSGAFTPAVSLSNAIFELDLTITCTAPGPTPNFFSMGHVSFLPTAASGLDYGVGGTSAVTSQSTEAAFYVQIGATWGTASASNSITMYDSEVWGLNLLEFGKLAACLVNHALREIAPMPSTRRACATSTGESQAVRWRLNRPVEGARQSSWIPCALVAGASPSAGTLTESTARRECALPVTWPNGCESIQMPTRALDGWSATRTGRECSSGRPPSRRRESLLSSTSRNGGNRAAAARIPDAGRRSRWTFPITVMRYKSTIAIARESSAGCSALHAIGSSAASMTTLPGSPASSSTWRPVMHDNGLGTCLIPECPNPAKYKEAGLCGKHYQRKRTRGTTDEPPKRGRTAEELAEYASHREVTLIICGHPGRRHYAKGMCEACYAADRRKDDPGKSARDWERRNPGKFAALKRRRILGGYGITPEDYEATWSAQGGRCANPECDIAFPLAAANYRNALQVDHCHRSGAVRGLLCPGCNRALGHADDDVARLEGLIEYLAAWSAAVPVTG